VEGDKGRGGGGGPGGKGVRTFMKAKGGGVSKGAGRWGKKRK